MSFACPAIMAILLCNQNKSSWTQCAQQYGNGYRSLSKPWSLCYTHIAETTVGWTRKAWSNTLESIAGAESAEEKSRSHRMLPGQE